jgi:hypothetical protein
MFHSIFTVVATLLVGLLFTPKPASKKDVGTAVVVESLHLDATETVWMVGMLPARTEIMPTAIVSRCGDMPTLKPSAGYRRKPPKKWEQKG